MEQKAKKICIELEDGTILSAEGEHAAEVYSWWNSCEMMNIIHGCEYSGKCLNQTPPPKVEKTVKE